MLEDFARRVVAGFRLGTADEEIEMLHRRVDLSRMGMLVGHGIRGFERLPVAHSLHQHEMHFVIVVERLSVQGGVSVAPTGHVEQ